MSEHGNAPWKLLPSEHSYSNLATPFMSTENLSDVMMMPSASQVEIETGVGYPLPQWPPHGGSKAADPQQPFQSSETPYVAQMTVAALIQMLGDPSIPAEIKDNIAMDFTAGMPPEAINGWEAQGHEMPPTEQQYELNIPNHNMNGHYSQSCASLRPANGIQMVHTGSTGVDVPMQSRPGRHDFFSTEQERLQTHINALQDEIQALEACCAHDLAEADRLAASANNERNEIKKLEFERDEVQAETSRLERTKRDLRRQLPEGICAAMPWSKKHTLELEIRRTEKHISANKAKEQDIEARLVEPKQCEKHLCEAAKELRDKHSNRAYAALDKKLRKAQADFEVNERKIKVKSAFNASKSKQNQHGGSSS